SISLICSRSNLLSESQRQEPFKGPFINGKDVSAPDLALGPKLYHLEIALSYYKNWSIPDSLSYTKSYMKVCKSIWPLVS
ncbi:Glutathione s-transferase dhar3 protein, partial [Thalictrum thalictroides]